MSSKYQIKAFPEYVLRTPLFSLNFYNDLLEDYSEERLLGSFRDPFVRESIRIASPELLSSLDKWEKSPLDFSNDKKSLEIALLKYLARMSARCTPFGLFAGCSVGTIAGETLILREEKEKAIRFTQFDMHFWIAILQAYGKRDNVRPQLTYFSNNSIYAVGDFYRYVEYKYVSSKREHVISAFRKSAVLEVILHKSSSGSTVGELISHIANDASEEEGAREFVYQLIDHQFLVSELEASVTGSDEWGRVYKILGKILSREELSFFQSLKYEIKKLDVAMFSSERNYKELQALIKKTAVEFNEKYIFQTDLTIATSINTLSPKIPQKIMEALAFLNGIQKATHVTNRDNFIKNFLQRYEGREMPLTTVLDTEVGIGYLQDSSMNDTHELLEKFSFVGVKKKENIQNLWSEYDYILQDKIQTCMLNNEDAIWLSEKDFPDFESNWNACPSTFSVMVEVAKANDSELLSLDSSGNFSAAKLLGRFCNGNQKIHSLATKIVVKESEFHRDKILAEVVHIPESRTGNILRRPILRDYEIAYLANPGMEIDSVIPLTDLMVSIKEGRIFLRSKKFNKEVIPCLSNAHNYSGKSLPIYHFLCDLQGQDTKPIYNFGWGVLRSHYSFFPRVYYNDILLSKAKWAVSRAEIDSFSRRGDQMAIDFSAWRKKRKIPRYVNLVDGDNTLLVDFDKEICIHMLLKSVKLMNKFFLEEFLFENESVVKNANGENFTNQFIIHFYKERIN